MKNALCHAGHMPPMAKNAVPVVLVTRFWAPSAKARAGQVADLWSRAAVARYRCPGKSLCLTVPAACTNRSHARCQVGLCALDRIIVVHVKFACFNLFEYFPNAVHVYDPVDKRVPLPGDDGVAGREAEWQQFRRFDGAIALSSFHARQLTTLGARRVWTLPMHSIAAAGCLPLSMEARSLLARRLPIRHANLRKGCSLAPKLTVHASKNERGLSHVPGGTVDDTLNSTDKRATLPLRVLIMGDSPRRRLDQPVPLVEHPLVHSRWCTCRRHLGALTQPRGAILGSALPSPAIVPRHQRCRPHHIERRAACAAYSG